MAKAEQYKQWARDKQQVTAKEMADFKKANADLYKKGGKR